MQALAARFNFEWEHLAIDFFPLAFFPFIPSHVVQHE